MPYKCIQCNKVVQTKEEQECECDTPHFLKCPVIHFCHEEGTFRPYTKQQVTTGLPNETPIQQTKVLNLCCDTKEPNPMVSPLSSIVTCPICLEAVNQLVPPPVEE